MKLRNLILESESGYVEESIVDTFGSNFPQYKLVDNSVKIGKFDSTKGVSYGTLKYTISGHNINSSFVYDHEKQVIMLGEE